MNVAPVRAFEPSMSEPPAHAGRTVWLLTDDRPGNRTQAIGVARALGWPFVEKKLAFNARSQRATPLLGATLKTLDEPSRRLIAPPWPDLVIGAGRRVAPVARWIKQASGGAARVVLVGRKTPGPFADLTIRCAYFRQAPEPKLLELVLPPTQVDAEALARARAEPDPLQGLLRPTCVFLVGGPTGAHELGAAFAERMARDVAQAAERAGAALAVVTSRRTPAAAVAAVRRGAPDALVHEWRADATSNPYLAFLAQADLLAVTGESESMLSEAAATGKPLTIYPLVARPPGRKARIRGRIASVALGGGPLAPLARKLMTGGWVTPRRDLAELHRAIERRGWGVVFSGRLNDKKPAPHDEGGLIRRRIADLF